MNAARLLPHEWVFGGFMLVMASGLVVKAGFTLPATALFTGFLVASVVLLALTRTRDTPFAWRLRLAFYPVAMNVLFQVMAVAVPVLHPGSADAWLQQIDTAMIGRNLSLRLETWTSPLLTEIMSFCYVIFLPYLTLSLIHYLAAPLSQARPFFTGLFTLYGIGFLGYLAVPAGGPITAIAGEFTVPLDGWLITRWTAKIVEAGSNHVDAFPSLHCAVSFYLLMSDRQFKPWRFRVYLLPAIGLWVSTIYLRYHYVVDVAAGFSLAFACLAVARWQMKREAATTESSAALAGHRIPSTQAGASA